MAAVERTRRGFLSAAGAASAAAGVGLGTLGADARAATAAAEPAAGVVPFDGSHQAGVTTPSQSYLQFVALDLKSSAAGDLRGVLMELSAAARKMTRGEPVGPLSTGEVPATDTGEALDLGPHRLTITFGLGPSVFGRIGLEHARPAALVELPSFATDALEPALSGGDIAIQVCAEHPLVAFHAAHDLIRLASPTARPRWMLAGFGRTSNSRRQAITRNLFGFKDGTANIMAEDQRAVERFVWADGSGPAWMQGGSYMVVRRIQMLFDRWDAADFNDQERTFGRHKLSGAKLARVPPHAHLHVAGPGSNGGERILRRGYAYVDGVSAGLPGGGLLFICYQRDPRAQFIPIQRRLARADALNEYTSHVGSAIFACPPGSRPGGYVGETLLG